MGDDKKENITEDNFGYMEELARAYRETLTKRLTGQPALEGEKRDALAAMQRELREIAKRAYKAEKREERRELSLMIAESAEECLRLLGTPNETPVGDSPAPTLPRAVVIANRSLNILIRHTREGSLLTNLVLSELSALYALAAIN